MRFFCCQTSVKMLLGEEMFFGGQQMTKVENLEKLLFDFGVSCMSTGVGLLNYQQGFELATYKTSLLQ